MTKWSKRTTTGFKSGQKVTRTSNSKGTNTYTYSGNVSGQSRKKGQSAIRITNTTNPQGKRRTYMTITDGHGMRRTETVYKSPPKIKHQKMKPFKPSAKRRRRSSSNESLESLGIIGVFFNIFYYAFMSVFWLSVIAIAITILTIIF